MKCARILEERKFYGLMDVLEGAIGELGTIEQVDVFGVGFSHEVKEFRSKTALGNNFYKIYASNLSEPFRSVSALEILAGLKMGDCTQDEECYRHVLESIGE